MRTYKITLTCTDPSSIDVKEMETQEQSIEAKAKKALELLEAVFKRQSSDRERE